MTQQPPRYEYLQVLLRDGYLDDDKLAVAGADGWLAVATRPHTVGTVVIMVRPVPVKEASDA